MEGRKKYNATWMYNITDDRIGRRKGTASSPYFFLLVGHFFFNIENGLFDSSFLRFLFYYYYFHRDQWEEKEHHANIKKPNYIPSRSAGFCVCMCMWTSQTEPAIYVLNRAVYTWSGKAPPPPHQFSTTSKRIHFFFFCFFSGVIFSPRRENCCYLLRVEEGGVQLSQTVGEKKNPPPAVRHNIAWLADLFSYFFILFFSFFLSFFFFFYQWGEHAQLISRCASNKTFFFFLLFLPCSCGFISFFSLVSFEKRKEITLKSFRVIPLQGEKYKRSKNLKEAKKKRPFFSVLFLFF